MAAPNRFAKLALQAAQSSAALIFASIVLPVSTRAEDGSGVRLYLSCPTDCFDAYLRQELDHFEIVRDLHLATLVIVRQSAGNGGERISVTPFPSRAAGDPPTR